jgi:glycosyltransferase involved in cell wall biosynthesis
VRVLYVSKASRVPAHRSKLARLGRHVKLTLLVPDRWGPTPRERFADATYPVVELPAFFHGHNHLHVYRGLSDVLVPRAFDLVHVDEEPYSLATAQVVSRARAVATPSLFFAWQNIDKQLPPPFGALREGVFRRAAGGIAGNEEAAAVLRRRGYAGPLAVIPQMGVEPEVFRPDAAARERVRAQIAVPESAFLVGFVGRLVPEKGVDLLLGALAPVPGGVALILGSGPERDALGRRAEMLGAAERVRFVGEVPSLEVQRWIAALDCLVLPSRTTPAWKEQFGRVLVEAMASEVPVVGSSSGEIPRVIGDAGRVFPEGDAGALEAELRALAGSADLRAALGRRGRARALAEFTQEKVVSDTLAFYARLAPSGGAGVRYAARDAT